MPDGRMPDRIRSITAACFALILFSCGATNLPVVLKAVAPDNIKGQITIRLCVAGSQTEAAIDGTGIGNSAACFGPEEVLSLHVNHRGKTYIFPVNQLRISRTGDGIPVEVSAQLPD